MEKGIKIIVTDTVHTNQLVSELKKQLIVIPTTSLFAEAIRCINNEESVSRLITS